MIERIFSHAHILYQISNDGVPELPISASIDGADMMVISQEGRHICINRESVVELCKLLKLMSDLHYKKPQ